MPKSSNGRAPVRVAVGRPVPGRAARRSISRSREIAGRLGSSIGDRDLLSPSLHRWNGPDQEFGEPMTIALLTWARAMTAFGVGGGLLVLVWWTLAAVLG